VTSSAALGKTATTASRPTSDRAPAECGALTDAIANAFSAGNSVVVMRFDYRTRRPLGFAQLNRHASCAFYAEPRARVCAKADNSLKLPFDPVKQGTRLASKTPERGPWVFHRSPAQGGGVIVLDDDFGTIFAASSLRSGLGEILAPTTWSTKDLGIGCGIAESDPVPWQAYDLRSGSEMAAAEAEPFATLAHKSVLPGLWQKWGGDSHVFLVLLYPRSTGDFDPQTTEVLVFLRGWTVTQ
jgi:hypothetical protein